MATSKIQGINISIYESTGSDTHVNSGVYYRNIPFKSGENVNNLCPLMVLGKISTGTGWTNITGRNINDVVVIDTDGFYISFQSAFADRDIKVICARL